MPLIPRETPQVDGSVSEVACEAFFGSAFFGVRYVGPDVRGFVASFSRALATPDFFGAFADLPLGQDFEFAEVGAEGAWRSIGAYRFDPLLPVEVVWEQGGKTQVWADTSHAKALEFTYANGDGTSHWFALPVSHEGRIQRSELSAALAWFRSTLPGSGPPQFG